MHKRKPLYRINYNLANTALVWHVHIRDMVNMLLSHHLRAVSEAKKKIYLVVA